MVDLVLGYPSCNKKGQAAPELADVRGFNILER